MLRKNHPTVFLAMLKQLIVILYEDSSAMDILIEDQGKLPAQ